MTSFPTYGTAGIGIAAAIGFVFALSLVVNTGGNYLSSDLPADERQKSVPTQEPSGGDAAPFADDMEENTSSPAAEMTVTQADLRPTLDSITALDDSREVIGEIVPGMEFAVGEPVVIQANFSNPGDGVIADHFIGMSIRNAGNGDASEQAANFYGDIAANGSVGLELYWAPQSTGDYTLLVFSATPSDLTSTVPIAPVASIQIKVVQ